MIEESQRSVSSTKFDGNKKDKTVDDLSSIYQIIKDLCEYSKDKSVEFESILKRVLARGFTEDALTTTLKHYDQLNILMVEK